MELARGRAQDGPAGARPARPLSLPGRYRRRPGRPGSPAPPDPGPAQTCTTLSQPTAPQPAKSPTPTPSPPPGGSLPTPDVVLRNGMTIPAPSDVPV